MNQHINRRRVVAALTLATAASGLVFAGMSAQAAVDHDGQSAHGVVPATNIVSTGKAVTRVVAATSDVNDTSASTTTLTQLPGMRVKITVPAGQRALLDARFSAETSCSGGGTDQNWCIAEILVDGVEAHPGDGSDFAIDSTNQGANTVANWQGHAMERLITVGAGTHIVTVVGSVTDFGATGSQVFWTGERSLVVERSQA